MAQDIKQKITLEGEKQYSAALKEARRHLSVLKSELKAETAELGNNASAQDKNRIKSQNLQKQIKEQEKVVKTLQEALAAAKAEYGDNEAVVGKWERQLNEARFTLANLKNDLDGMGDTIRNVNSDTAAGVTATRSFAEAIDSLSNAGGNVADSIQNVFLGALDVIRDAVAEIWGLVADTAAKANEWTDIAEIWNTDPAKVERYARGVAYAGKSFSDLQTAVSKIATGDADKIRELTGVSWAGDADEWQYAMDVLSSISGMGYQKKLETLSALFGDKRAGGIMDIVNAWSTIEEGGDKLTQNGYGLGESALSTMNEIQERIEVISASWEALKDNIAGKIGEATLPIMLDVQGGLDGIAEYLNAGSEEERTAALEKIRTNVEQFFRDVAAAIRAGISVLEEVGKELQGSDDAITRVVGDALVRLTGALEWLMDENNWDTIKAALEAFFGLWLSGRALQALGLIGTLAANLMTIKGFSTLKLGGGGGGSGTGTTTGGGGWLGTILRSPVAKGIGAVATGLGILFENALTPQGNDDILTPEELEQFQKDNAEEIAQQRRKFKWNKAVEADGILPRRAEEVDTSAAQRAAAETFWDIYRQNPDGFSDEAWAAFENAFAGNEELFNKLNEMIDLFVQSNNENDEWRGVENLPDWMFSDWNPAGNDNITGTDLQNFRGLPAQIQAAARAGTAAGVSGIRVELDGATVGRLVAPTVSAIIAAEII